MNKLTTQKALYLVGIGLGIIIVTAFVSSQLIYPVILGRAQDIETPNVVGISVSSAKRILNESKIHVVVKDSLWSEDAKLETVLEQKPSPGTMIKPDGTVYLVISKGSKVVNLPSLLGMNYQQAYLLLRNMGLKSIVADSTYSESYPVNSVIQSIPNEGTKVKKNTIVRLYLSRGPEPIEEPSLGENQFYPY